MLPGIAGLVTDAVKRKEIYALPLQATTEQLKGFPSIRIQTVERDMLSDEDEVYGRKPDAAGVAVTSVRYNDMIHDYGLLNVATKVPASVGEIVGFR